MKRLVLVTATSMLLASCGFDDPTPTEVAFSVTGSDGEEVQMIISTKFVAGVREDGVTEVSINQADTVFTVLPISRVVSVRVDQRFFVEVLPMSEQGLPVSVEVFVDDRRLLDKSGTIDNELPFRYVYLYNQPFTQSIDVVF